MVHTLDDLPDGGETELFIRDLTPGPRKYDARHVRAKVASSQDRLPEGDILRIRSLVGVMFPQTWYIKVLEEIDDYQTGHPYEDMLSR
jgi:hypothetical protein